MQHNPPPTTDDHVVRGVSEGIRYCVLQLKPSGAWSILKTHAYYTRVFMELSRATWNPPSRGLRPQNRRSLSSYFYLRRERLKKQKNNSNERRCHRNEMAESNAIFQYDTGPFMCHVQRDQPWNHDFVHCIGPFIF